MVVELKPIPVTWSATKLHPYPLSLFLLPLFSIQTTRTLTSQEQEMKEKLTYPLPVERSKPSLTLNVLTTPSPLSILCLISTCIELGYQKSPSYTVRKLQKTSKLQHTRDLDVDAAQRRGVDSDFDDVDEVGQCEDKGNVLRPS